PGWSAAHSCGDLRGSLGKLVFGHRTAVFHEIFKLVPETGQEALHRPRRGFAERADRVPLDLAGDRLQAMQIVLRALAVDDARQHAIHPAGAFAARRALAAGLGHVETRDAMADLDHARGLVHHDDRAGAEARTGLLQAVVVH